MSHLRKVWQVQNSNNLNKKIDECFYKLEQLSSQIADSITVGNFGEVTRLDLARKVILQKISKDTANLNEKNRNRLKLIWVNNCKLVDEASNSLLKKQKEHNLLKKTFRAYSNN